MSSKRNRKQRRQHIRRRFLQSCRGSAARPRLSVFRSLRHVYAQLIDDAEGKTLASVSTLDKELSGALEGTGNIAAGTAIGTAIAGRAKAIGVETVVFDRAGFPYHGVVKSIAEAAREAGLKF